MSQGVALSRLVRRMALHCFVCPHQGSGLGTSWPGMREGSNLAALRCDDEDCAVPQFPGLSVEFDEIVCNLRQMRVWLGEGRQELWPAA